MFLLSEIPLYLAVGLGESVTPQTQGWRGTARAEDAQGRPIQWHMSPSIPVYEEIRRFGFWW